MHQKGGSEMIKDNEKRPLTKDYSDGEFEEFETDILEKLSSGQLLKNLRKIMNPETDNYNFSIQKINLTCNKTQNGISIVIEEFGHRQKPYMKFLCEFNDNIFSENDRIFLFQFKGNWNDLFRLIVTLNAFDDLTKIESEQIF